MFKQKIYLLLFLSLFFNSFSFCLNKINIKAFDELIKPKKQFKKERRLKDLKALAAILVLTALAHIENFEQNVYLEPGEKIVGKQTISKIKNKLSPLEKRASSLVHNAVPAAIFSFNNKVFQDALRLNKIEATQERKAELLRLYKTKQFRRQLIDVEFEVLDEQYQKVLQVIEDLGESTDGLPAAISLQDLEAFSRQFGIF